MEHQTTGKTNQADTQHQPAGGAKPNSRAPELTYPFHGLQQLMGNRTVGRLIQTKLNVSQPDDHFELEADRVADQVMRMPDPQPANLTPAPEQVQRACSGCAAAVDVSHEFKKEDDRIVRRKAAAGPSPQTTQSSFLSQLPDLTRPLQQVHGDGSPLQTSERAFFEPRFGHDFSNVRVHFDQDAASAARALQARAYTTGRDIVFASGEYSPSSVEGRRLLAHELAHVVQQGSGAPAQIQRTVDNVEINCADNQVYFSHDGAVTSYTLDHCNVSDGTYDAGVTLGPGTVDFDLGIVPPGTLFDFHYSIGPGQPGPNTFFVGQRRVPINCTHMSRGILGSGEVRFNAHRLTTAEFEALTGRSADLIPEGVILRLEDIIGPAVAGASRGYSSPWSFVPRDTTGVLWTQGHTSIFANPEGVAPTIRGYRGNLGYYAGELVPFVGRNFTVRLHEGVPGSFANDAWFPLMPGEQYWVFAPRSHSEAESFASRLLGTDYGGDYTYSPPRSASDPILGDVGATELSVNAELQARGVAPMCTNNCITVPTNEIEAAIGGRPTTPSGVDVMTGRGPEGVVDPHYAGRGRLMTEAMSEGPLPAGASRLRITAGGATGMFVIRGAGGIMLIYGIYHSAERISSARGTRETAIVVSEEAGSWTGGILGSALGGAAGGAIFCSPTGPIDAVCVVGGFVGGLLFGLIGGAIGHGAGHEAGAGIVAPVVEAVEGQVTETLGNAERSIYNLYGVPYF